jgi:hypothetical protein
MLRLRFTPAKHGGEGGIRIENFPLPSDNRKASWNVLLG